MREALITLALAGATILGGAAPESGVVGLWQTPVDGAVVKIEACGAGICGRAISSSRLSTEPDQRDVRNHDPSLRGRSLDNLVILRLRPLGPGHWGDGTIYNPDDGNTYRASVELVGSGKLHLRGCIVAPLCRTQTWTRVAGKGT